MKVVRLDNLTTNLRHTRVKCPAVSQSEDPSAFTHPSQHFPLRHVSGRQGRNTSRLLQQDIAGVTSSSGISADNCVRVAGYDSGKGDYGRLLCGNIWWGYVAF